MIFLDLHNFTGFPAEKLTENSASLKISKIGEPFVTFPTLFVTFSHGFMRAINSPRRELLFLPLVVQNIQVFVILHEFKVASSLNDDAVENMFLTQEKYIFLARNVPFSAKH